MLLRPGRPEDAPALTDIALRSKASWGYDDAFMARVTPELSMTPARIAAEAVVVAEVDGHPVGFSATIADGDHAHLEDLFIDPDHQGTGIGTALLDRALAFAATCGATHLDLDADPYAEDWYLRRGAVRVGERRSPSTGRSLPHLEFALG